MLYISCLPCLWRKGLWNVNLLIYCFLKNWILFSSTGCWDSHIGVGWASRDKVEVQLFAFLLDGFFSLLFCQSHLQDDLSCGFYRDIKLLVRGESEQTAWVGVTATCQNAAVMGEVPVSLNFAAWNHIQLLLSRVLNACQFLGSLLLCRGDFLIDTECQLECMHFLMQLQRNILDYIWGLMLLLSFLLLTLLLYFYIGRRFRVKVFNCQPTPKYLFLCW